MANQIIGEGTQVGTRFREKLNLIIERYLDEVGKLRTEYEQLNDIPQPRRSEKTKEAIKKIRTDYSSQRELADNEIYAAFEHFKSELVKEFELDGSEINDNDMKLLTNDLFILSHDQFEALCIKYAENRTMLQALAEYARRQDKKDIEKSINLGDKDCETIRNFKGFVLMSYDEKYKVGENARNFALQIVRRNDLSVSNFFDVGMKGELFRELERV